jgi:hypothetical protein
MRRVLLSVLALLVLFAAPLGVVVAEAAPSVAPRGADCTFALGFQALYEQIPDVVGECTTDELHNPDNGDALQQTTNGLLAWRKLDNWTAFTDGATTWIIGPEGLQDRPNDMRFCWEPEADPRGCDLPGVIPSGLQAAWDALGRAPAPRGSELGTLREHAEAWLAASNVYVGIGSLPGAWGAYSTGLNLVRISPEAAADIPEAAAAVLMHELRHAAQEIDGPFDCVEREVDALAWEAFTWARLTDGGLEDPTTPLQVQENLLLALVLEHGEEGLRTLVVNAPGYQEQCDLVPLE